MLVRKAPGPPGARPGNPTPPHPLPSLSKTLEASEACAGALPPPLPSQGFPGQVDFAFDTAVGGVCMRQSETSMLNGPGLGHRRQSRRAWLVTPPCHTSCLRHAGPRRASSVSAYKRPSTLEIQARALESRFTGRLDWRLVGLRRWTDTRGRAARPLSHRFCTGSCAAQARGLPADEATHLPGDSTPPTP
jgi:hypothetical protein